MVPATLVEPHHDRNALLHRALVREVADPNWGGVAREHFVAFDLETSGRSPQWSSATEIGAVRFDGTGRILGELVMRVDPQAPLPALIVRLTGLDDRDVRGAMGVQDAMRCLDTFSAGAWLVGHNVAFDMGFCGVHLPHRFSRGRGFDTLGLARILIPGLPAYKLTDLSSSFHLDHDRPHSALSDARATTGLFLKLIALARELPAETLPMLGRKAAQQPFNRHMRFFTLMAADRLLLEHRLGIGTTAAPPHAPSPPARRYAPPWSTGHLRVLGAPGHSRRSSPADLSGPLR